MTDGPAEARGPVARPATDVVVPFAGSDAGMSRLLDRATRLELGPRDTLVVVDNRRASSPPSSHAGPATVLRAPERQSSYYARNRGARSGRAEWLLFLDADVQAPADLLDRYFSDIPARDVAQLVGAIRDQVVADGSRVADFLSSRGSMSQDNTWHEGPWAYGQTANCLVRREAFELISGFVEDIRSGGDADLSFRLRDAGWRLEARPQAEVVHTTRTTLRALVAQRLRHGSGIAWINRRYPGSFPAAPYPGLLLWSGRRIGFALAEASRGRGGQAWDAILDVASSWAFQLGRLRSNQVD